MGELRAISADAVERAIGKAERYRLLNEPREAASICEDVLAVDSSNAEARQILLLAITDQFDGRDRDRLTRARSIVDALTDPFQQNYLGGVVAERWGKAMLDAGLARSRAKDFIDEAMTLFDEAEAISPPGNDDAILRWNTCVRLVARYELDKPAHTGDRDARLAAEIESAWDDTPA